MAPLIAVHSVLSMELSHSQVMLETLPSGSVTEAVKLVPTWGSSNVRLTVPASSSLVTAMVTSILSLRPAGSSALTLTAYVSVVS